MGIFGFYIQYLSRKIEAEIEKQVKKFLPEGKNLVYVDLGCDDGKKTLKRAAEIKTDKVSGVEIEALRKNEAVKKGIKVYQCDLNKKWPFESNSIDCITATEVVEHLVDLDNFFEEAKRVLKPKGRLIISTENLSGYHNIFALLLGNQPYTGPYLSRKFTIGHRPNAKYYREGMGESMFPHLNVMTSKSLKNLLENYGFKVKQLAGIGFYPLPSPFAQAFVWFDKYHASYCVALGEK